MSHMESSTDRLQEAPVSTTARLVHSQASSDALPENSSSCKGSTTTDSSSTDYLCSKHPEDLTNRSTKHLDDLSELLKILRILGLINKMRSSSPSPASGCPRRPGRVLAMLVLAVTLAAAWLFFRKVVA